MSTITPGASVAVTGSFATSPAASGTFIPSIWSGKLNAKFYATTVFGEIANTSYEGEIKNIGDKVVINTHEAGPRGAPYVPVASVVLRSAEPYRFTTGLPLLFRAVVRPPFQAITVLLGLNGRVVPSF